MDHTAVNKNAPGVDTPDHFESPGADSPSEVMAPEPAPAHRTIEDGIGLLIGQLQAARDDLTRAIAETSEAAEAARAAAACAQRVGGLDYALWVMLFGAGALIGSNLARYGWL